MAVEHALQQESWPSRRVIGRGLAKGEVSEANLKYASAV